jgi:alanine racemase
VFNRIEVSRSALLHNVRFFQKSTGLEVIPVLKGNAYGHGIEQVATALRDQDFRYIAVDGYFEALKIRAINRRQPVLIMGMIRPENFARLSGRKFTFVVHDETTLLTLGRLNKRVKIHLELNTGMNRYGIPLRELGKYIKLIKSYPRLRLEGVMTHLADPDGASNHTVHEAVRQFDEAVEKILASGLKPTLFHTAQSAGALRAESGYANAMRLGIGLYGINPYPSGHKLYETCKELRPALCLISTISKINELQAGDKVSYNYTFTAPKTMRLGVLPLGYHEGVNRALSNSGVVQVAGHFQPIVGRVCMNHTLISLAGATAKVGDEVVVYSNNSSDENSIDRVAAKHGLFPYSLLTALSPDVRRYLVE